MPISLRHIFLSLFVSALLAGGFACTTPKKVAPVTRQTAEDAFSEAERLYSAGELEKALTKFDVFLKQYPQTDLAAAALMKTALIYAQQGAYESAMQHYERLIAEYPGSMFALDARVGLLDTLSKLNRNGELIRQARQIPKDQLSRTQKIRIAMMVSDAEIATGLYTDATQTLIGVYSLATPLEQNTISEKIKDAFIRLTENDIQQLLQRLEKPEDIRIVLALKELTAFENNVVGCLLPLTGPYKSIGRRAARGVELAYHQWMAKTGKPFKLLIQDTGADRDTTIGAVQDLLDEKVAAIIGPIITADLAARTAQERRVPIITLSQKEGICETGEYVFRNFITPKMQVKALLDYAMDRKGAKRFAILYPKEKYGTTFMNHFFDEVIAKQGEVVGAESYDTKETDFANAVKKLVGLYYPIPQDIRIEIVEQYNVNTVIEKDVDYIFNTRLTFDPAYFIWSDHVESAYPETFAYESEEEETIDPIVDFDALFVPDAPEKVSMIVPQLPYFDVHHVQLLGPNIWHSKDLIELARHYVQGAVVTEGFFSDSTLPQVQAFIAAFEAAYEQQPGFVEAIAFDTTLLLLDNLSAREYQLRSDIQQMLAQHPPYVGVTGRTAFDETGEAVKDLFLLKIRGSRFLELSRQN